MPAIKKKHEANSQKKDAEESSEKSLKSSLISSKPLVKINDSFEASKLSLEIPIEPYTTFCDVSKDAKSSTSRSNSDQSIDLRSLSPSAGERLTSTPKIVKETNNSKIKNNNLKSQKQLLIPPSRLLTRQKPIEISTPSSKARNKLLSSFKNTTVFQSKTPPVRKKTTDTLLQKPKSLIDIRSSIRRKPLSVSNKVRPITVATVNQSRTSTETLKSTSLPFKSTKLIAKKYESIVNDNNNNNQLKSDFNNGLGGVQLRKNLIRKPVLTSRRSVGEAVSILEENKNKNQIKRRSLDIAIPTITLTHSSSITGKSSTSSQKVDNKLNTERGQGPSSSKNSTSNQQTDSNHHFHSSNKHLHASANNLKSSNSVSSLDELDRHLKPNKKTNQKHHGSNDKLQSISQKEISVKSSSKDKLTNSKECVIDNYDLDAQQTQSQQQKPQQQPIKYKKKQQSSSNPNYNQMPIPQTNVSAAKSNQLLDHQRDGGVVGGYNERSVDLITIDPNREISMQQQSMMQELQSHLERLTREKMALEAKVTELSVYQTEVQHLRNEIFKLQTIQDKNSLEIQKLTEENDTLRNRLRDVVNSPLSDAEKHQLIQDSQRLHSSAPASIALPNNHDVDGTPCVTPDWDKNSSSSEISVACLQDKIIQMEETHYSTNEELQATLQELADLQAQLGELQSDNERLAEEKDVLFQSLCRQTEKLEDSRNQIGTLQELLLRESNPAEVGTTEREQKLLDLLKNAQEERENLFVKQEELNSEMNELRLNLEKQTNENGRLRERICLLDSTVDAATAERKQIESQLAQAKEESSEKQIEISRLSTLLDNARSKIDELEQDRAMGDKTDLGELLDSARREKDLLEAQVASLQEQLSKCHCEIQKLKDQLAGVTEECKVARNNAKYALSDLEYKYETLKEEKEQLSKDYQGLQDNANELQVQCKCHLEDKAQLESLLSETQRHLGEAERMLAEKEEEIQDEIKKRERDAEEWNQFQSDLLMTVRVANDFKTEAQIAREQLVMDNKSLREKIRSLETQIEKLNKQITTSVEQAAQKSLLTTVQQEMAARRQKGGISRQDSRLSVKSLIESIENVNKQTKSSNNLTVDTVTADSKCSSSSSLNSLPPENFNSNITSNVSNNTVNLGINTTQLGNHNGTTRSSDWSESIHTTSLNAKSPLREQQQTAGTNISITLNGGQKSIIAGERKDPLNALVKNGGSKRNALLKWCQNKTVGYRNIDITNFSSSWNDGLAFCAILHSYLPDKIPYDTLGPNNKRRNFSLAFSAAESVGIQTTLNINEMCQQERPDWTQVMAYVTAIYKHFEA